MQKSSGWYKPRGHYSQCDISKLSQEKLTCFIGEKGINLKNWTDSLNVRYIWYNKKKGVIEIWGPVNSIRAAQEDIKSYIEYFTVATIEEIRNKEEIEVEY
jgi:hypothetical protein